MKNMQRIQFHFSLRNEEEEKSFSSRSRLDPTADSCSSGNRKFSTDLTIVQQHKKRQ
jgi:hypothetical protein